MEMFISPIEPAKWFDRTFFLQKNLYISRFFPNFAAFI